MKTITVLALTLSLLTLPVKAEYGPLITMSNPFVSVENIEAAQAGAGFKFQLPFLLQCFAQPQISYIKNSLIQVLYGDPQEKHLLVRKGHGTDDN